MLKQNTIFKGEKSNMPKSKQEKVSLSDLMPVPYNPRIIQPEELENLKSSIKIHTKDIPENERGEGYRLVGTVTINTNGYRIVGGHQRIKALYELGQTWIDSRDITWVDVEPDSAREKALNITLNSERFTGRWDEDKYKDMLKDIKIDDEELFKDLNMEDINIDMPNLEEEKKPKAKKETKKVSEPEPDVEEEIDGNEMIEESESLDGNLSSPTPTLVESSDENTDDQLFPISYAVTAEQRKTILAAITKAKEMDKKENSGEALAYVCGIYLG